MDKENFKQYLPSRNFWKYAGIVGGVLLVFISVLVFAGGKKNSYSVKPAAESQTISFQGIVAKDTDNDGLPDWEEALWGTDPNDKDTSGNGIGDKAEVDRRKERIQADTLRETGETSSEEMTDTDKFSREFFATVAALKQSGNFNQESLSGLADSFSRSVTAQPLLDKYSLNDAKTVSMSDQSVSKYYDDFFEKISIYVSTKRGSELEIIAAALGLSSTERIKELDPIIKSYDDLAKELISISVPSDAVSAHLSAVNDLVKIALSLENAKSVAENPIRGVMGIAQYQKYNADLEFDFERINQYFENSGIISQTEQ